LPLLFCPKLAGLEPECVTNRRGAERATISERLREPRKPRSIQQHPKLQETKPEDCGGATNLAVPALLLLVAPSPPVEVQLMRSAVPAASAASIVVVTEQDR
jgi:hypothetical protein